MRMFTDGKNSWSIDINVGSIKRVLATTPGKVNLSLPHEPDEHGTTLAERLIQDIILQVDVIWALLEPQAKQLGIDMDAFFELFKPEVMQLAESALIEEWTDFFRKLGRAAMAKAIEQAKTLQAEMISSGLEQLERLKSAQVNVMKQAMTEQVDNVLQMATDLMSGKYSESATKSPEGLELQTSTI